MLASERGYRRLLQAYHLVEDLEAGDSTDMDVAAWRQSCYDAMNDDFNSPILIAQLFEAAKWIYAAKEGKETFTAEGIQLLQKTMNDFLFDVLGLEPPSNTIGLSESKLNAVINLLIEIRNHARENKDFATSDQIRDRLAAEGIQLKDGKEGTT